MIIIYLQKKYLFMNKNPSKIQYGSTPKLMLESLKRDMEESGLNMTPFQESVAESVLAHTPASDSQTDEMIAVLEAITTLMKKAHN